MCIISNDFVAKVLTLLKGYLVCIPLVTFHSRILELVNFKLKPVEDESINFCILGSSRFPLGGIRTHEFSDDFYLWLDSELTNIRLNQLRHLPR